MDHIVIKNKISAAEKLSLFPKSCTSMPINLFGVGCFGIATFMACHIKDIRPVNAALISLLSFAIPIIILEFIFLKTFRRASTGLDFSLQERFNGPRIITKLLGFYSTLAGIAFVYWLLPEYHGTFYKYYWEMLAILMPVVIGGAIFYFMVIDRYMPAPEDGNWHMGMALLGKWAFVDPTILVQHMLGWMVKAFFLPLMFIYLSKDMVFLRSVDLSAIFSSFKGFYDFFFRFFYTLDLTIVCVGYILTIRLFDSYIRSTDSTLSGWLVALVCYQPFWSLISRSYLNYDDHLSWGNWLSQQPLFYMLWGLTILFFQIVYVLSSVAFGLRFSNLTNRGILTNGPYRFTKHPAYISKCITWWLISIPFISGDGFFMGLRHCLLLLGLNFIYFLRARTEERHLSRDPVYCQYAMIMNERSVFSRLGQIVPLLKYQPPRNREEKNLFF